MDQLLIPQVIAADLPAMLRRGVFRDFPMMSFVTLGVHGSGTNPAVGANNSVTLTTGVTANSDAGSYVNVRGMGRDVAYNYVDMGKELRWLLELSRGGNDAQCVTRIHLKNGGAIADLAAVGLGIKIVNAALYGNSFGSSGALVDLGYNMIVSRSTRIEIVLIPGVRVEWWVNGSLKGTQTTAANVPIGSIGAPSISMTISNGAAGGVDCNAILMACQAWQEI